MGRTTWRERWTTLCATLIDEQHCSGDDDDDDVIGARLDAGGHAQDVWDVKFGDKDLVSQGGLPGGQFGEIDVTLCRLDKALYVRKAQPRRQVLQATRERDVLLRARRAGSVWSPHLLCAYKEEAATGGPLTYTLVMSYVPGGTLEDVLESCLEGGMAESDVRWWFSQAVCAIGWLHEQGWAHRDIKPSNLAITSSKHLQLLDFGCAAPLSLSTTNPSSSPRRVLPYDDCLVPCGTCDYLSPEVLIWHETALARARRNNNANESSEEEEETWAQDWSEDVRSKVVDRLRRSVNGNGGGDGNGGDGEVQEGYGPETDWWSLGAMVYELAYGVAPFFAPDVATTYKKVLGHKNSLRFPAGVGSLGLESVLRGLLTGADQRLGRHSVEDIKTHAYFNGVEWDRLHMLPPPTSLVTPQFTYAPSVLDQSGANVSGSGGQDAFAFSALFQSTVGGDESRSQMGIGAGDLTGAGKTGDPSRKEESRRLTLRPGMVDQEVEEEEGEEGEQLGGFTWGPPVDAFDHSEVTVEMEPEEADDVGGLMAGTPFRLKVPATPHSQPTPFRQPLFGLPSTTPLRALGTPFQHHPTRHPTVTPYRQTSATPFRQTSATPFHQTGGTHRHTSATPFRQLANSATPFRQLAGSTTQGHPLRSSANGHMLFKTPVRPGARAFNPGVSVGPGTGNATMRRTRAVTEAEALRQVLASARKRVYLGGGSESSREVSEVSEGGRGYQGNGRSSRASGRVSQASGRISRTDARDQDQDQDQRPTLHPIMIPVFDISLSSSDGATVPPSPSPSPRPGSALSRRSATPSAAMMTFGAATPSAMYSRSGSRLSVRATTPTWTGRASRRDESDEDEESDGEREAKNRERKERAEKERRARLEKERERARKEELARLERQREKGKGRERDVDQEREREVERRKDQERTRPKGDQSDDSGRKELERLAQLKLEQERRRLERKKEARRREEAVQLDQEVEAARLHELGLAEEMARRDEAKRRNESRDHGKTQETEPPRLSPAICSTGRRRVKSATEATAHSITEPAPQSILSERRRERRDERCENEQERTLAPILKTRTRTRSHNEPLVPCPPDNEKPRSVTHLSLDDVAARQKRLVHDVDTLQGRVRDVLRALQAGQT